jgi:N-dimethylarginine dimethylaminohydrolase
MEKPARLNLTQLDVPAYLMNIPFSYSTDEPNNLTMHTLGEQGRLVNIKRAMKQFLDLYYFMASQSVVQILPTPANCQLQDLVFISNLGIVLPHLTDSNTVIISNFKTDPRIGETEVGVNFFTSMGYKVYVPPYIFEGEAELKHLHDNVYIGGYGLRTDIRALEWLEKEFDMKIIKAETNDGNLYHLDCTVFPVTKTQSFVCTDVYPPEVIKQIEREIEIIDVSRADAYRGITNSVRMHNLILNASHISELKVATEIYDNELHKNRSLEDIAARLGFEVVYFNLSEFIKGGALLSCLVMHLNSQSSEMKLI